MKLCQNCGEPLEDCAVFCGNCGARLEDPTTPAAEPQVTAVPEPAPEPVPAPVPEPAPAPAWEPAAQPGGGGGGFCPNCGNALPAGVAFCPNCGNPVTAAPGAGGGKPPKPPCAPKAKTPKGGRNRIMGIAAAVVGGVVALVLIAALVGKLLLFSPVKKFTTYNGKVVEAVAGQIAKGNELVDRVTNLSTDLTITADTSIPEAATLLKDSSIEVKLDLGKDKAMVSGSLSVLGSQVLDGTLTYADGKAGFCLPQADPSYYVFDLAALAEDSGVNIQDLSKAQEIDFLYKYVPRLLETYGGIVLDTVNKDNLSKSDRGVINLRGIGERVDGTVYTFAPSAEDLEDLMLRLGKQVESDKDLLALMEAIRTYGEEALGEDMGDEDFKEALKELGQEIQDRAPMLAQELEGMGLSWRMGLGDDGICLEEITVNGTSYALERTEDQIMVYGAAYDSLVFRLGVRYTEDHDCYTGSVTVGSPYMGEFEILHFRDVDLDQRSGLGVPYGSYSISYEGVEGSLDVSKGKGGTNHLLSIRENGSMQYVEANILSSDKKSSVKKPKGKERDITELIISGEADELFYELGQEMEYVMEDVMRDLAPALGW